MVGIDWKDLGTLDTTAWVNREDMAGMFGVVAPLTAKGQDMVNQAN